MNRVVVLSGEMVSASGDVGATRLSRYAKGMQLDGYLVSEDVGPVVLIHKQQVYAAAGYVWFVLA